MTVNSQYCPGCGASYGVDAKFCGNCGRALGASAPPAFSAAPAAEFARGDGPAQSVRLTLSPSAGFDAFARAVVELGGRISRQNPPNEMRFSIPHKSDKDAWAWGLTVNMDGEIRLFPEQDGGTTARVSSSTSFGSLIPAFLMTFVFAIVANVASVFFSEFWIGTMALALIIAAIVNVVLYSGFNGKGSAALSKAVIDRARSRIGAS